MASFLDKIKVKTAVDDRVKLDLGCDHITTANFMQYNVAWSKELVPKEKISVSMETFTRLNPMPVPTFGRAKINNRAFFVPFRTIFPGWNDFITDAKHTYADGYTEAISEVPVVGNDILVQLFIGDDPTAIDEGTRTDYAECISVQDDYDGEYDIFVFDRLNGANLYWKLTAKGRQVVKVLESLGYKINWYIPNDGDDSVVYSALPILAMAKVYCDWYYPSAYVGTNSLFNAVEAIFHKDTRGSQNLGLGNLESIFRLIINGVNYDSDYFVSAWDNPVSPNSEAYSRMSIGDPTLSIEPGTVNNYGDDPTGTPFAEGKLTQWMIDGLKSLTDYMKRHQLVGARALDRYLARFGINLSAEKLRRSVYLGSGYENIQFGDVMSTADTDGASLGNYAGKGIGYGTANFDYETDEYGIMIIISSIVPKAGYYQGVNRNVMHVGKLDYWTPEFDNLGTQAISKSELFVPFGSTDMASDDLVALDSGVFGWTPRYAEYKIGRDMLTGDFRYDSMNAGQEAWHTMRELNYTDADDIVHNVNFVSGRDAGQYSRIFYNTDAEAADKFNVIYHFEVASWSPMKALFDTYEFDSKGASVTEDANGVKMN